MFIVVYKYMHINTFLRRVALEAAQLVCMGVQLLLGRASAPPGGSFT